MCQASEARTAVKVHSWLYKIQYQRQNIRTLYSQQSVSWSSNSPYFIWSHKTSPQSVTQLARVATAPVRSCVKWSRSNVT
jgi:hypothetical protein